MADINPTSSHDLHVLIIGAGITGLLLAQGLKKAGIQYTIFDAEDPQDVRAREWTLGVNWSLPNLSHLLPEHLYDRLREAYCDPFSEHQEIAFAPMYNSETGELIHKVERPGGIEVSRRRFRKLCGEGIEVQFRKTLTSVSFEEDKITAHFADGSKSTGEIIIGADGTRSVVREQLLGAEKSGRTMCRLHLTTAIVKYDDPVKAMVVRSAHPHVAFGYHPDGIFTMIAIQTVPDLSDPTTWEFYLATSWLGEADPTLDNAGRLSVLKSGVQKLADPFRSANTWISDETRVYHDKIQYWVPVPWDNRNGRITLAGDAAHPMPPYRGQGTAHCICDAANLVDALKEVQSATHEKSSKLAQVISAYEAEMIRRGAEEVNLSVQSMYLVHDWEKLMESPVMKIGVDKAGVGYQKN